MKQWTAVALFQSRSDLASVLIEHAASDATSGLANLEQFSSYWGDTAFDPFVDLADKVRIESALLLWLLQRLPDESRERHRATLDAMTTALEGALSPHAERTELFMRRFPHTSMSLGVPFLVMDALGQASRVSAVAKEMLADPLTDGIERKPFRVLDLRWLRSVIHGSDVIFEDLMSAGILGRSVHPSLCTRSDVYALTHWVFYATDFGTVPLDHKMKGRVVEGLKACLAFYLMEEDLDLTLETALALRHVGDRGAPESDIGLLFAGASLDHFGFIPSPSINWSDIPPNRRGSIEARSYIFRHTYHTTYVAALLAVDELAAQGDSYAGTHAHVERREDPGEDPSVLENAIGLALRSDSRDIPVAVRWLLRCGFSETFVAGLILDGLATRFMRSFELSKLTVCTDGLLATVDQTSNTLEQIDRFRRRLTLGSDRQHPSFDAHTDVSSVLSAHTSRLAQALVGSEVDEIAYSSGT